MALNWLWDKTVGTLETVYSPKAKAENFRTELFEGNAYLIFINRYTVNGEGYYDLCNFWVDKEHMKRCLGTDKNYPSTYGENMYAGEWTKLTLYTDKLSKAKVKAIVGEMSSAFDSLTICLTHSPTN